MKTSKKLNFFIHLLFICISICMIVPLLVIISISISNEADIGMNGFKIIPNVVDFSAYRYIFKNPETILRSYWVTFVMSFSALFIYIMMGSMTAYALSQARFKARGVITVILLFTMLFSGGMVPSYLLMTQYLHLKNTYAALVIPLIGNVWYVFIMKTFMAQLPASIFESASIDGADDVYIYFKIVLPLSKPVIATVSLLTLIGNWNSWNQALLYIDKKSLYPLQYMLQILLQNAQEITNNMDKMPVGMIQKQEVPTESVRMAMAIIAIGPLIAVFPFFQKYFVQGLTVGSVKG